MRLTVIGLVALGLFAAVCAAVLVAVLRVQRAPKMGSELEAQPIELVVAVGDLPAMTVVDATNVEIRSIPANEAPPGAIRSPTGVIGKVLVAPLLGGQPFTNAAFARDGSGVHLASVLKDGYRAMSISLQNFSGLDGLLYPGSIVDVVASFRMAEEGDGGDVRGGELISTVLLEAVQVLAIEAKTIVSGEAKEGEEVDATRTDRNRRMITLLVDPRQAEALQLASAHGTISLALRNPLDLASVDGRGTSFLDLSPTLSHRLVQLASAGAQPDGPVDPTPSPPTPEEPPAVPSWETVVIRGTDTATQSFDLPEGVEEQRRITRRTPAANSPTTPGAAPPPR